MENIDSELVDVIAKLNEIGMETEFSCQGHEHNFFYGYIKFSSACEIDKIKAYFKIIYSKFKNSGFDLWIEIRNKLIYFETYSSKPPLFISSCINSGKG